MEIPRQLDFPKRLATEVMSDEVPDLAAGLAQNLGLRPDAFLIAVAVGAGSDFLTPIGHQCNTLVMGPGGYNFGDYWRLGLPLSIIVALAGTALIMLVWPLH